MKAVFPTNDKKTIAPKIGLAKGFLVKDLKTDEEIFIENEKIKELKNKKQKLEGDCGEHGFGVGQILPKKLNELGVEIFVAKKFGEGMLDNLEIYNIKTLATDEREIEKIIKILKDKYV
jgi:predicted Fe-Mo cluster-binding NifX family protein